MKKRILLIFLIVPLLGFSQTDTTMTDAERRKLFEEFLDVDLYFDARNARNHNLVNPTNVLAITHNPELRKFLECFSEQTGIAVHLRDSIAMGTLWARKFNLTEYQIIGEGDKYFQIRFIFVPKSYDEKTGYEYVLHPEIIPSASLMGMPLFKSDAYISLYTYVVKEVKKDFQGVSKASKERLNEVVITALEKYTGEKIDTTKKTSLYFTILESEYKKKDVFSVMYMNKSIDVKLMSNDTSIDLSKLKWVLNAKEFGTAEVFKLLCTKENLPKDTNLLAVFTDKGIPLGELKITPYEAPIVSFSTLPGYNGEFLFDTGYCYPNLHNVDEAYKYKSFTVTRNGQTKTYYAPVVGIYKGEERKLKVTYTFFRAEDELKMKNDKNFKIEYIGSLPNRITTTTSNINELKIKADETVNEDVLTSMHINIIVQPSGEKVGMFEYYCAIPVKKEVTLFIVKFKDQTTYPVDTLSQDALDIFLNINSLNQLFVNTTINIKTIRPPHTIKQITDAAIQEGEGFPTYILKTLNDANPVVKKNSPFNGTHDYYYITSLTIPVTNNPTKRHGGFHIRGNCGGAQLLGNVNQIEGATTAHELGHWLSFPDSFNSTEQIPVIADQSKTNNYMDYFNIKKTWVKIQLLNSNRASK